MQENKLRKASDKLSGATQVLLDSFGLIKIGDWMWGDGGYGQVTQIFHDYYEEYDNHIPEGKTVGDYKETWGLSNISVHGIKFVVMPPISLKYGLI